MSTETTNYLRKASDDAGETIQNFADEILEQLLDDDKASDDLLNDYPDGDSWHHESHVDKNYNLHEAAELLYQLNAFEETDSGLWEGQSFREAISTCAAFTYGNAVYSEWREKIEQINREAQIIINDFDDQALDLQLEIVDLNKQADDALATEFADCAEKDAKRYRHDAEHKQLALDDLDNQKKEALRKLIENVTATF